MARLVTKLQRTLCPTNPYLNCVVEKECNSTLTTPRSLDVTKLIFLLFLSSSLMFQTLTNLSVPPVTIHPLRCGLTSMEEAAPSWAANVNLGCDGFSRADGNVLTSKFKTMPFSKETYGKASEELMICELIFLHRIHRSPKDPTSMPRHRSLQPHLHPWSESWSQMSSRSDHSFQSTILSAPSRSI